MGIIRKNRSSNIYDSISDLYFSLREFLQTAVHQILCFITKHLVVNMFDVHCLVTYF